MVIRNLFKVISSNKRMKKRVEDDSKKIISLVIRYLLIILIAIPNMYIIYRVFTPITVYPVYFLLNLFYDGILRGTTILFKKISISIIDSCVAGSAYYLLFMLNLSIPEIPLKKRIKMIFFSSIALLAINIFRIFFLSILVLQEFAFFDVAHKLFWYFLSTIFVVGIWFLEVYMFKVKETPFLDDLKFLYKISVFGKEKPSRKKTISKKRK